MTETPLTATVERLHTRSPRRIWGVSVESVYTALAATAAGDALEERLTPHTRAETLRTNDIRENSDVIAVHEWLLDELGFYSDGKLTLLGAAVLTADRPRELIRPTAVSRFRAAETILRSCRDAEDLLPRSEFESMLAEQWDKIVLGPLLASLGFVTVYPDSVDPDSEVITAALESQKVTSVESASASAYAQVVPHVTGIDDRVLVADIVNRLVDTSFGLPSLPQSCASLTRKEPLSLDEVEFERVVAQQLEQYEDEYEQIQRMLLPTAEHDVTQVEGDEIKTTDTLTEETGPDNEDRDLLLNVVATVSAHPELGTFDLTFVTDRLSITPYEAYQALSRIPGVEAETSEGDVLVFDTVPETVDGEDRHDEYTSHLVERCAAVRQRMETLANASVTRTPPAWRADRMVAVDYGKFDDGDVAPMYFTYTLIDPDALGDKKMSAYVGNSRGLGRERARLRRWHSNRPAGMKSYTEMTDRLFSLGLEREFEDKILRIMTPFDDDTFNAYVSNIRRLLDDGYELRLLTRHTKKPWEWERLQENLLSEIKNHRDRVTVRTYSRFQEHQQVTPEQNFMKLGELGIHGKLQTIGHAEEGASLLGSANFMRNSFDWNPECGIYTQRTPLVAAAIKFFDIVWDISAADELAIERLQEVPNRQLVPSYYS